MTSWRKNGVRMCVSLAALLWLGSAGAVLLTGTFQGRAINAGGPDWTVQDGDPIDGKFYLDTGVPFGDGFPNPGFIAFSYYDPVNPTYPFRLSFGTPKGVYTMDSVVFRINMYDDGHLWLNADTPGSCCAASLDLYAPPGALFDAQDPSRIHAGPIDLAASSAKFATHGYPNFDVELSAFSFDGFSTVPEPGSLSLIGAALAAAGIGTRRRGANTGRRES